MTYIDPRGIQRKVTATEWKCDGSIISFECGHTTIYAPHFDCSRIVGERRFCFKCGQEARELDVANQKHQSQMSGE